MRLSFRFAAPLLSSLAGSALAAPPSLLPDADVLVRGACNGDLGVRHSSVRHQGSSLRSNGQFAATSCGIADDHQIGVAATRDEGLGERFLGFSLTGKHRLFRRGGDENGDGPTLALTWNLNSYRINSESWRYRGFDLGLAASHRKGAHEFYGHLGNEWIRGDGSEQTWGLGYSLRVAPEWSLLTEWRDGSIATGSLGLGAAWQPNRHLRLGALVYRHKPAQGISGRHFGLSARFSF